MTDNIACLRLRPHGLPWLVIEDNECERECAIALIFGEDGAMDAYTPKTLIVERIIMTREELDKLPDWDP